MVLSDSFYYQPVQIDTINTRVISDLLAKEGDANARGILLQITENGIVTDTTGISLRLQWQHTSVANSGFNDFEVVDATRGLYKLKYPTAMLNTGNVEAFIRITDGEVLAGTRNLLIKVERMIGDDSAIVGSNDFSALQEALVSLNAWNATISGTIVDWEADMEATKQLYISTLAATEAAYPQELNSLSQQLAQISPDDTFDYSHFISNMTSYLGLENKYLSGDGGTRFYILPRLAATTGLGGAIKIFGDPYHLQNETNYNYRDLGIYFMGSQNGDTGVNGKGVFWINSKVMGPSYIDNNPDIGFSFQDGTVRAGRFTYNNKSGSGNVCLILGHTTTGYQTTLADVKLVLDGGVAFNDNTKSYIRWNDLLGTASNKMTFKGDSFEITMGGKLGFKLTPDVGYLMYNGTEVFKVGANTITANRPVITPNKLIVNSAITTLDTTNYSRVKFGVATAHTIDTIVGVNGQQVKILFAMGTTTIAHNATIKLAGGVNFVGTANDVLVLEHWDGIWYEDSRSVNG